MPNHVELRRDPFQTTSFHVLDPVDFLAMGHTQ